MITDAVDRPGPVGGGRALARVVRGDVLVGWRRAFQRALSAAIAACLALACSEPSKPQHSVQVFAAASLREACADVAALWRRQRPDVELVFNFAASNILAQQIRAARSADVFLSADTVQMEEVRRSVGIALEGPTSWLSNQLVVVAPSSGATLALSAGAELADERFRLLSLANPEAVPAGRYAREWLQAQGLWARLASRVVPGVDVRAALAAVENGACELGIVYATDAAITERVRIVFRVPLEEGPRIEYSIAALHGRAGATLANEALAHFVSRDADACFARRGFLVGRRD